MRSARRSGTWRRTAAGRSDAGLKQAEAVLAAARPSRLYAYLVLSLLSGVRTGEAQPLTWDPVFLETADGAPPPVAVWRSVRKHGETKTRKSRRTIALPKQVVDTLEERKRWQKQERAANVRRDFQAIVKRAGLAPGWTPRELRYSFVLLLSDHGIPLERIAQFVGHTSQSTAEAVYRKQVRSVITEGAEAMDVISAQRREATAQEA
ncbi:site-specific integrase [Streptomyces sp. NPDC003236]